VTLVPRHSLGGSPAPLFGVAALTRLAFTGSDVRPLWQELADRLATNPRDAGALLDLGILAQLAGERDRGLALQAQALEIQRCYLGPAGTESIPLRLLAFVAPGDLMANTPVEFLLEGSAVSLDLVYVVPGRPLPQPLPEHELAVVAVGESDENRAALRELAQLVPGWPRPVLNPPERIAALSRENTWRLLQGLPEVITPPTERIDRERLEQVYGGDVPLRHALPDGRFPILVRPVGSHAGHGLAKIPTRTALGRYLRQHPESQFFVTRFCDYRSPDRLFRKYRIAVIEGRPFACHLAISARWMVHYLNAGMTESSDKRAEEAQFMAEFKTGFGRRHAAAIHAIAARIGLDYFAMDCGELPDGRLLVFEVDVAMIVHAMDPPDMFPYKQGQMRKLFAAFYAMLEKRRRESAAERGPAEAAAVDMG